MNATRLETTAGPVLPPMARGVALTVLVLLTGWLVVALGRLGTGTQVAAVLALGAAAPVLLLFAARPYMAIFAYLLLLPLVVPTPVAGGLNGGELLTLLVVTFGLLTLWGRGAAVRAAHAALRPILWPLAGLAVVGIVSMLVNEIFALQEIASALFKILAFGVVAVLVHVHADSPARARSLLLALLLGAAAVAVYSVVSYLAGWSYYEQYDYDRAAGTFTTWNHLGGYMALLSMPTLAMALSARSGAGRLFFAGAFVLEIVALLLSLTLGSLLALAVAFVVAAPFLFRGGAKRVIGGALLFLAAFALVWLTNPLLQDKVSRAGERVLDRLGTYAVGLAMFRDQFWFGFGSTDRVVDALYFSPADYGITAFGQVSVIPHNSLLLMGAEKGVFGVLFFAALILGSIWLLWRERRRLPGSSVGTLYQGVVVGALAFLVQNMTNNLIIHARLGIVFFSLLVVLVRLAELGSADESVGGAGHGSADESVGGAGHGATDESVGGAGHGADAGGQPEPEPQPG